MNLELAKKKLEKINRLIATFEPGENHVSRLEKDLIMSYTRDFYDAITESTNGQIKSASITTGHTPAAGETSAKKVQQQPETKHQAKQEIKEEVIIQQYTEAEKEEEKSASRIIAEEATAIEVEAEQTAAPKPVKEAPQKQTKKVEPIAAAIATETLIVDEPKPATATVGKSTTNPELLELFAIKKANEISEKLSQLPISDLNKAMGVNEKIFVKNELFGGDDNLFRSTLSKLNTFQNFDEAKDYLATEVADSFEWTAPDKSKKAKNFIQLVYRRYK